MAAMTPTLLELIVAVLLLVTAWQIGVLIAPRVLRSLLAFWRTPRSASRPDGARREKNITPPGEAPGNTPSSTHGHTGR